MKKQTFLKGSLLLTVSALLAKILGAFFKLPLTAVLGGTGMGYFSCAYGLFLPLYAVFVTGLSTAVAKMVASYAGMNNMNSARYVRSIARKLFFSVGIIVTIFACIGAKVFTIHTTGNMEAYPAVLVMTPAILFCCLTAVERGYYEGLCCMTPTAVSQAVEALTKLIFGLLGCYWFQQIQFMGMNPESAGACGAVAGVTLSTLAGYLCMFAFHEKQQTISGTLPTFGEVVRELLKIMIPVSLGALVTNLTSLIDLFTVMRQFTRQLEENPIAFYQGANLSREIPLENASAFVYGSFMGLSVTVFNLVPSLTNMLAKGVLPCTAQAWASGDKRQATDYARQVLLLTGLVAIPSGCGIFALSKGTLEFLFAGQIAEIETSWKSLQYLAIGIIFLCMTFPVFSLLQAVGKADIPVKVMLFGVAVKFVGNLVLIPHFYTAGAGMSTSICYLVILILAVYHLRKTLGEPLHLIGAMTAQCYGGIMCGVSAWLCYGKIVMMLPQRIAFIGAVFVGAIVYVVCLFLTQGKQVIQFLSRSI